MGTRVNRYYNNPAIGQAFSNLASIFEPPDPTEILAYAQAEKVRQENQGLASLYGLASDPNANPTAFDRAAIAAGRYAPSQSYHAVGLDNATKRYGIGVESSDRRYNTDVGAQTAITTNENTVRGNVIGDLYGPLSQGQVRPAVPDEIMDEIGMSGVASVSGAPKPLSETEVEGKLMLDAITKGMVSPKDAADAYISQIPVEQIVGEGGDPEFARRGDVVGAQPYINPGSQPAPKFVTYMTPDGQRGTAAVEGSTLVDHATRQPLPQGTITGDVVDSGGGALTTGVQSSFDLRGHSLTGAMSTIDTLDRMVAENPASQGLVGQLRGTAQDVIQTGNEIGRQFGGTMAEVSDAVASGALDAGLASQMYDPSIPAIEMQMNVLAWQYAKAMGDGRVSNEQLRMARAAIGDASMFSNQASTRARLAELRRSLSEEGSRLLPNLSPQLQADLEVRLRTAPGAAAPAPNATAPRARNPQTGEIIEWNGTAWVPVR